MTHSGKTVHTSINEKIRELENEHEKLAAMVYDCERGIGSAGEEREECYAKLATVYLPEMTSDSVRQTLREVQGEVQRIFKEKQERRRELESRMDSARQEKKSLQERLDDVTGKLEHAAAERDRLQADIAKELDASQAYVALHGTAAKAQEQWDKQNKASETFRNDAERKLATYRENSLFNYLLTRSYATDGYDVNALARKLDGWVAGIVDYKKQKASYDFLSTLGPEMEAEVARRKKELDTLVGKLRGMEREAAERHGLPKVLALGQELTAARTATITDIERVNAEHQKYASERTGLDNTKDTYHQEAVQKLKDFLKGNDLADLKARARATKGTEDDELVDRIESCDARVKELKQKASETKGTQAALTEKINGLHDIERQYRKKDYDSSRSYFKEDFDIGSLLLGYIAGSVTSDMFHSEMKEYHKFKPAETYTPSYSSSDFGTSHRSSSNSSDSGGFGGFGGGSSGGDSGFSSGGSFGGGDSGGGFSTGGEF